MAVVEGEMGFLCSSSILITAVVFFPIIFAKKLCIVRCAFEGHQAVWQTSQTDGHLFTNSDNTTRNIYNTRFLLDIEPLRMGGQISVSNSNEFLHTQLARS